jgi:two-component system response regulator CssR
MEGKMTYRIGLVDDEKDLASVLQSYLEAEGYEVRVFYDGLTAAAAAGEAFDLWVLDIMLPGIDGYGLLKKIRQARQNMPIVFISARDADIDRVMGLEMGSDDYIPKPFLPRELVVRVSKLLQRVYGEAEIVRHPVTANGFSIDFAIRQVSNSAGQTIAMTTKEFDLLAFLSRHLNQQVSREQILDGVWGQDYFGNDRAVDDLVRRLRKKTPELKIETIYGYGYRLVEG